MFSADFVEHVARGLCAPFLFVFKALPDTFGRACLRSYIQQALISFGILDHNLGLPVDSKNEWAPAFLEVLHELPWIAPKGRHRLDIFRNVYHLAPSHL
jgi:hypothetical protein